MEECSSLHFVVNHPSLAGPRTYSPANLDMQRMVLVMGQRFPAVEFRIQHNISCRFLAAVVKTDLEMDKARDFFPQAVQSIADSQGVGVLLERFSAVDKLPADDVFDHDIFIVLIFGEK